MEFLSLGIGSATPHLERHPSASLLTIDNFHVLLDCGEGTQVRLLEQKIKTKRIKYILISHLHGDHFYGLIGFISTLNMSKRTEPLFIFGPSGIKEILSIQMRYSESKLNFELNIYAIPKDAVEILVDTDTVQIKCFPLQHRVDCSGFIVTEKFKKRKVLQDLLPESFPKALISKLQNGDDVLEEYTGVLYANSDFTAEGNQNKSLAYCSDTIFDPEIIPHVKEVDVLYHESTFTNELENRANVTFHSTASQAASIARDANVKRLILGHFSARYKSLSVFLEEGKEIFSNTSLAVQGEIIIF